LGYNLNSMTFLKLNFTKKIFLILIITAIFSVTTFLNNTIASGLKILGQGIFDNTATSSLSIDTNNRKLIYPDGVVSALDWSTTGKVLINGADGINSTAGIQVKGESANNLAYFDNGTNQITIKSDGQLVSNTAEGTAPFSVLSTTLNNNLNADLFDNYNSSDFAFSNQSVKYTINGTGLTLPTIVGQSGKVLTNDGSALSWGTITALTAEADTLSTVTNRGVDTLTSLTLGQLTFSDGAGLIFSTGTGTKIGTATNQKLAFFGVTPIVQPINTVPLDTVLVNLGLRASGGNPSVSTNFKIGSNVNWIDYTLTFDGETTDGVITWMEKKDQFKFNDRLQTDGGRIGKVVIPPGGSYGTRYDETIVGTVGNIFILPIHPSDGTIFTFKNIGASPITISPNTSQLINGVAAPITLSQWSSKRVQYVLSAGGYIAY
jgi:hypothetical protein